jgi:hypothetical protein
MSHDMAAGSHQGSAGKQADAPIKILPHGKDAVNT